MWWQVIIGLLAVLCVVFYKYMKRNTRYYEQFGLVHAPDQFPLGSFTEAFKMKANFVDVLLEQAKSLGFPKIYAKPLRF